jgi:hypothetical protein
MNRCYQQHPEFDNPRRPVITGSFHDNALSHHEFAMRVHMVVETIFDIYDLKIPGEWIQLPLKAARQMAREQSGCKRHGYVERDLAPV